MENIKDVTILAIESSCDETAAAVVRNGREVLSNTIYSQIDLHTLYGGVVPEIASRKHIEKINQVIKTSMAEAKVTFEDIDAIGVTYGPGLVGALLVGVAEAKAMAYALRKPLVGVHHIEGHIAANYVEHKDLEPPYLCLVVSGGHTHLVKVNGYAEYEIIGRTHDDAAGEAFDKVARAIGLGYPGGPKVDKVSKTGRKDVLAFPRAHIEGCPYDFSFSGLKSAVLNYLNSCKMKQANEEGRNNEGIDEFKEDKKSKSVYETVFSGDDMIDPEQGVTVADVAASFQEAVVDALVSKTMAAAADFGFTKIAIAGGVASNSALRAGMKEACEKAGYTLYYPSPILCTDNAAMIGCAAYYEFIAGTRHGLDLNAVPNLKLGER
ncbi:MAG: tRNA (adenosine(37)-N6)-threonylcarbamoyltransferase complex transferase subunit TsaD [Lachnospiraceae bacterium]|nr:tRNA (adenosine(37)-N6)-threonylcarbamoyltransferase complex transferase subunit TsaD [Lachnospiraceae bacterium]